MGDSGDHDLRKRDSRNLDVREGDPDVRRDFRDPNQRVHSDIRGNSREPNVRGGTQETPL